MWSLNLSKILIVGIGPLLSPESVYSHGGIFRTHHLVELLRDAGHAIDLVVLPADGVQWMKDLDGQVANARLDSLNYSIIYSREESVCVGLVQQMHDSKDFDCVVSVGGLGGLVATGIGTNLPVWIDLSYCPIARAQVSRDNHRVYDAALGLRKVLSRADKVSVSSFKHMCAVQGQLGVLGRFNDKTPDYPFVSLVPLSADRMFLGIEQPVAEKKFRGSIFPDDAFVVLWSGGYEPWGDVKSLAGALSLAMEQIPKMHFVSTGGAIPGEDPKFYDEFREDMRKTGFIDRCVFLDWIPLQQLPQLYCESDLGINLESLNYDTLLGNRNRIVNMMAAGLCVLSTLGTEQSEILADNRLGYTARIGKIQEFTDAIIRANRFPNERRQLGIRARSFVKENLSPAQCFKSLLKWISEARLAPDNGEKLAMVSGDGLLKNVVYTKFDAENRALADGALQELANLKRKAEKKESEAALERAEGSGKASDLFRKLKRKFSADEQ